MAEDKIVETIERSTTKLPDSIKQLERIMANIATDPLKVNEIKESAQIRDAAIPLLNRAIEKAAEILAQLDESTRIKELLGRTKEERVFPKTSAVLIVVKIAQLPVSSTLAQLLEAWVKLAEREYELRPPDKAINYVLGVNNVPPEWVDLFAKILLAIRALAGEQTMIADSDILQIARILKRIRNTAITYRLGLHSENYDPPPPGRAQTHIRIMSLYTDVNRIFERLRSGAIARQRAARKLRTPATTGRTAPRARAPVA